MNNLINSSTSSFWLESTFQCQTKLQMTGQVGFWFSSDSYVQCLGQWEVFLHNMKHFFPHVFAQFSVLCVAFEAALSLPPPLKYTQIFSVRLCEASQITAITTYCHKIKLASIYCTCYSMDAIHTMVKLTDTSEHSGIFGQHRSLAVKGIVLLPNCRDVHMFSISGGNSASLNKGDLCVSSSFLSLIVFLFCLNHNICLFFLLFSSSLSPPSHSFPRQMTCTQRAERQVTSLQMMKMVMTVDQALDLEPLVRRPLSLFCNCFALLFSSMEIIFRERERGLCGSPPQKYQCMGNTDFGCNITFFVSAVKYVNEGFSDTSSFLLNELKHKVKISFSSVQGPVSPEASRLTVGLRSCQS